MRDAREVALEAGRRRLAEIAIPTGSRVVLRIGGELLAAKVGSVGRATDDPQVEVFASTRWPSFVMTTEVYERAHGGEDVWLAVATGPTSHPLVPIEPSDCRE